MKVHGLLVVSLLLMGCNRQAFTPAQPNASTSQPVADSDSGQVSGEQTSRQVHQDPGSELLPQLARLDPVDAQRKLRAIPRKLEQHPTYETDAPTFCLLVLGPEMKTRVWLALDGQTLYADANQDGLLGGRGERFQLVSSNTDPAKFSEFQVFDGDDRYEVTVHIWHWMPQLRTEATLAQSISVTSPDGMRFGAWGDQHARLTFQPTLVAAPVVHIGGPLQLGFEIQQPLRKTADNEFEISAAVGTRGLGPGSFSYLFYTVIPESAFPDVTLQLAGLHDDDPPLVVETKLDHRC